MKNKHVKLFIYAFMITIFILLAVYLGFTFYFRNHFFFGSTINGIDSSRMNVESVEKSIRNEVKNYVLQIDGREDLTDIITADDIDYKYVSDGAVEKLLDQQNPFMWISSLFNQHINEMQVTTTYDERKLAESINALIFFQENNVRTPVDATVKFDETREQYVIIPEDNGTTIDANKFKDDIVNAIKSGDTYYNIEDNECYSNAKYTSQSTELVNLSNTLNDYINVTITYDFGDRQEICDKTYIKDWLTVDDNFDVSFNLESVRSYIDSIARIYNTWGKTRDFVNHDGKIIEVSGGDYGWLINRSAETERLVELVKAGKSVQVEPTYSQTARSRTINDIGDSYIEIDLSLQHVWVYKDGNLVVDTDCVTGNSSRGHDTPTGIYQITYKERDATLNGENYSSPVKYWMPFYYNVGLHDASWRSTFGGQIYKRSGSHGCVNLPSSVAEIIFNNIEKGTPVVCYKSQKDDETISNSNTSKSSDNTENKSNVEDSVVTSAEDNNTQNEDSTTNNSTNDNSTTREQN